MRFAIVGYTLSVLFAFVERKIFVMFLSAEYLGLGGVISNVISMLSIAELGFGEAIMYSLYKPIKDNDQFKIIALLDLYKKAYVIIVATIAIIGLVLLPFLPLIIGDTYNEIPYVNLIYCLFLISTLCSYIGAHKRSLIIAYQKRYIVSLFHNSTRIGMYLIQIVVLVLFHNYYLYLLISVIAALFESFGINYSVEKRYPIVKETCTQKLNKTEKNALYKNISAMAAHKRPCSEFSVRSAFCDTD